MDLFVERVVFRGPVAGTSRRFRSNVALHFVIERELRVGHAPPPLNRGCHPAKDSPDGVRYDGTYHKPSRPDKSVGQPALPQDQRVLARMLVVVAAHAFDGESEALVQPPRGVVRARGPRAWPPGAPDCDASSKHVLQQPARQPRRRQAGPTARLLMCSSSKIIQHAQYATSSPDSADIR